MRLFFIFCLILSAFAGAAAMAAGADTGVPVVREFLGEEAGQGGYPWTLVWAADGTGYLGRDGLWRWDGAQWQQVGPAQLANLRALEFDAAGLLWLGSYNEIGVFDPATLSYESRTEWIPPEWREFGNVWALHADGETIWVGTEHSLFRVGADSFRVWEFAGDHRVIFHFLASGVYAHEVGSGIWRIDGDDRILVCGDPAVAEKSVIYLEDRSDGCLVGLSGKGLFHIFNYDLVYFNDLSVIRERAFSAACRVASDILAVGSLDAGIHFIRSDRADAQVLKNIPIFNDRMVIRITTDNSGRIWILDTLGVSLIEPLDFSSLKFSDSNISDGVVRDFGLFNHEVYISSENGFFALASKVQGGLSASKISDNESYKSVVFNDSVVFDSYDKLKRYSDGAVEVWWNFDRAIWSFEAGRDGLLYVSFNDGVEGYRAAGDTLERVWSEATPYGLQQLEADAAGRVWGWSPRSALFEVAEGAGGRRLRRHDVVAGRDLVKEPHVVEARGDGPVIVFEDGMVRYDGEADSWQFAGMQPGLGLPLAQVFRRQDDALEGWLVYWDDELRTSLMAQVRWPLGGRLSWELVPWIDMRSLGRIHLLDFWEAPEEQLVIVGKKGMLFADPGLSARIPAPDQPVIWDAATGRHATDSVVAFGTLGPGWSFGSPLSSTLYPVRYQSRIAGLESDWGPASRRTERELGQLMEGDYTLEVRAIDPFGRVSPAATVAVRVLPPWHRTVQAYLAGLLAVGAAGYVGARLYARKLRQRQAELEVLVDERTRELRQANTFKDDFIANLSHEIRNPLNGVIGLIGQLREGMAPPPRHLLALKSAARYLQSTVEEVLDFAKLQSGRVHVERRDFDLREMVTGVVGIYEEQAAGKGLEISCRVDIPSGTGVHSDERKIQQILGNLLSNAVKFTQEGRIQVDVQLRPAEDGRGIVEMRVEDTGPGITELERERIFEKFYQVRGGVQKSRGTGLGLALVKAYVELLGGSLALQSEPGRGSVFLVDLPVLVKPLQPGREPAAHVAAGRHTGLRALVIDDYEYNLVLMEGFLNSLGLQADLVADGEQGIRMAETGDYRVIFLDWDLPGMTGLDVATRLRAGGRLADGTRIIGMTAYATLDVQQSCLEGGMDAFITKPLDEVQLRNLLAGMLPETAAATDPAPAAAMPAADPPDAVQRKFVAGKGILGEMRSQEDWESIKLRWLGYFDVHLQELEQAIAEWDPEQSRKAAHKLLGHMRMLQVRVLPEILQDLLTAAHASDMDGIIQEWQAFSREVDRFRAELATL